MNEYEFEVEVEDGWYIVFRTFAACKLTAYENLIEHLKECGDDLEKARVLNCYILAAEGEEGNDNT